MGKPFPPPLEVPGITPDGPTAGSVGQRIVIGAPDLIPSRAGAVPQIPFTRSYVQPWRVNDLLRGFLFGHSREGRARRLGDLEPWFAFCTEFAINALLAKSLHVAGFAAYETEAEGWDTSEVSQHLFTLWKYYRHAQGQGAVVGNPVTMVINPALGMATGTPRR